MQRAIGFGQYDVQFGAWETNARTVARLVGRAPDADLLVFPEMGLTGYEFRDRAELEALAEPCDTGRTAALLLELAERHNTTLVIGYPESAPEGFYNACMMALPDGKLFNYRKLHLFSREKDLFLPGARAAPVHDTPAGRVGLMICFDWFFPEVARCLALSGAQIIVQPSNLVLPWCQQAMFARSLENAVFTITANRVGTEARAGRTLTFTGRSQMLDPRGNCLAQAPTDGEHIEVARVDVSEADSKHVTENNDLFEDRRPEMYRRLTHSPGSDR